MNPLRTFPLHRSLLGAALLVAVFAFTGCGKDDASAQSDAEEEGIAYTVGDPLNDSTYAAVVSSDYGADTLTTAEFQAQFQRVLAQFPMIGGNPDQQQEVRRVILEDFIVQHVLLGEADQLALTADAAAIDAQLAQIRSRYPTPEAFQEALAAQSMTEDSLRSSIATMMRQQQLQEQMAEEAAAPSAEEMDDFRREQAEQVRAQHILFLLDRNAPAEVEDSVQALAQAVLDSAKQGTDFGALAQRHSQDGTSEAGGDLNYFSRGQMVPPFEEVAFALADSGDLAPELVRTRFGYHIIRLTGRRTGELMDTTQARQLMMRQRQQEVVEEGVNKLLAKATIHVNPDVVEVDLNEPSAFR
jgi:peptidyl-prolyl cis-trans isomerase C